MEIIDAVWEKRNLGVNCKHIKIEINDKKEYIDTILKTIDANYVEVVVRSNVEHYKPEAYKLKKPGIGDVAAYVHYPDYHHAEIGYLAIEKAAGQSAQIAEDHGRQQREYHVVETFLHHVRKVYDDEGYQY